MHNDDSKKLMPEQVKPTVLRGGGRIAALLLLGFMLATAAMWDWLGLQARKAKPAGSGTEIHSAYAGSAICRECHEAEFAAWKHSNHGLAERDLNPAMDAAGFVPPQTFRHGTQQTSFRTNDGRYELITVGLHGTNEVFKVERVLANYPLRQMLIPLPGGRVQVTEAAWDPRTNEWFNVYGSEDRKPGEWGHWLGRGMNWNSMCATCHNTRLLKNYDAATDSYHTTFAEHGVGCESCHGPMRDHNEWQRANKGKNLKDPTVKKLTRDQTVDNCAACHSRRLELTGDSKPGDSYWDHFQLTIVDDTDIFYPDGQIRDEDYEVTAFFGSRMFHKGVRCMDCHDVHTMKTKLPGNFLCLQCHGPGATNAPSINPVTHSHHKVFGYETNGVLLNADLSTYKSATVKVSGGECVNCHMPQTVYMQRHSRHDHGFTTPDPWLTKKFNIPNACERCHADKGTDWNLQAVEKWYGTNINRLARQRAEAVTLAKRFDPAARDPLLFLLATNDIPYWSAVAAGMLQPWAGQPEVFQALKTQLGNPHPLVRQKAVQSLGTLIESGRDDVVELLRPMLKDSSRNVRVEAARFLSASLDTNSGAGKDYLHFLANTADQPLGQMQIGFFALSRGDATNALKNFQRAVEWDPYSTGMQRQLAVLLSQLGRPADAVKQLEQAIQLSPNDAELHYSLALAYNETGEAERVISELRLAVKTNPRHARAWYNLGLAQSRAGDRIAALDSLVQAENSDAQDASIPYAHATVLAQLGKLAEAKAAAQRALALNPNFTEAAQLLQSLEK